MLKTHVCALTAALAMSVACGEDLSAPVRPGGVEGRPFWNRYSIQFLYGLEALSDATERTR